MKRVIDYWSDGEPDTQEIADKIDEAWNEDVFIRISWKSNAEKNTIYILVLDGTEYVTTAVNKIMKIIGE